MLPGKDTNMVSVHIMCYLSETINLTNPVIKRILLLYLLALFSGCSKQNDNKFVPEYNVPAELEYLVSNFIREAARHGRILVINNLIIKYDSSIANNFCAISNSMSSNNDVQKIVRVNPNLHCYNNAQEREALFFHEFGHCILGRSHDNRFLPNGNPRSIMIEDKLTIYSPCTYPVGGNCQDNTYKREYYMDELFNERTPIPTWAH